MFVILFQYNKIKYFQFRIGSKRNPAFYCFIKFLRWLITKMLLSKKLFTLAVKFMKAAVKDTANCRWPTTYK